MSEKKTAVLFPGQGAHDLSMLDGVRHAKDFAERYETIRRVLGSDPVEEIRCGNREYLNQNKVSSLLTVLASSLSLDLFLEHEGNEPDFYGGYSVGLWTALYAAGALSFEKTVEAVAVRAECMDECFRETQGGMMAFIGIKEAVLENYLDGIRSKGHSIAISNYNCAGQYSVAGTKEAIEIAYANADSLHPRKVAILPVQGAWHCELVRPAERKFSTYLEGVEFAPLKVPVMDTLEGGFFPEDPNLAKERLARHISHPVRWEMGIRYLIDLNCDEFVEVGYGNVLTKFGFFIDRDKTFRAFYSA